MGQDAGAVPYDTCTPYLACSSESEDGFCPHIDTTCTAANTCKTCDTFGGMGGKCSEIDYFPNATVAEYGLIEYDAEDKDATVHKIASEIFARGPVAATINAEPIVKYTGGIFSDTGHSEPIPVITLRVMKMDRIVCIKKRMSILRMIWWL